MQQEINKMLNKVKEELILEMRRLSVRFKWYIKDYHCEFPGYYYEKDKQYGCKNSIYYYYILPEVVPFIYQNSLYHAEWIFFNDKFRCWLVYDENKKEYVTFEALDTDSQIKLFRMLDNFLNIEYWSSYSIK